MNKRVVSLLLSVVMICCLLVTAVPASAAENDGEGTGVIGGNPIGGLNDNYDVEPPEQDSVRIEVPFKLIVKKTGEMDPGKETFKFVIENFGAQTEYAVVQDTVETNGEKTYDGEFVFTVNQSDVGNLEEGFVIRQVKGNAEGWTYDEAKYRVEPTFDENRTAVVSWRFLKADENGEFDYDNNLNEIVFTNSYNAKEQDRVRIEVPFKLIVKKTGEMDPGKETFKFVLENFGAQTEYAVVQDTVETNGEKTYDGEFVFTVNQSDVGNLEEGFVIRQVKGNAEGWTYDEAKYRVEPTFDENRTAVVSWRFLKADENGEFDYDNNLNEIVFTNSYNAKKPATPPTPQNPESPKTGDSSNLIGWLVALSVSGGVLTVLSVNSKKRKGSEAE